jgi:hypothetical protein
MQNYHTPNTYEGDASLNFAVFCWASFAHTTGFGGRSLDILKYVISKKKNRIERPIITLY